MIWFEILNPNRWSDPLHTLQKSPIYSTKALGIFSKGYYWQALRLRRGYSIWFAAKTPYILPKNLIYCTKEPYILRKRALHTLRLWREYWIWFAVGPPPPAYSAKEPFPHKNTIYCTKEPYIFYKRALYIQQTRPLHCTIEYYTPCGWGESTESDLLLDPLPYIFFKSALSAKEPHVSYKKALHILQKSPEYSTNAPRTLHRRALQTLRLRRQYWIWFAAKTPYIIGKRALCIPKKSPMYSTKKPCTMHKRALQTLRLRREYWIWFAASGTPCSLCVTWLVHACDTTHLFVWHDLFMSVTWLIRVWRGSFMCVLSLVRVRDTPSLYTPSYVWLESFMCMTCLIQIRGMPHSCAWHAPLIPARHASFVCLTWLIRMCDMPNAYVWNAPWHVYMYDMTHLYMWHVSFICVTLLIDMVLNLMSTRGSCLFLAKRP